MVVTSTTFDALAEGATGTASAGGAADELLAGSELGAPEDEEGCTTGCAGAAGGTRGKEIAFVGAAGADELGVRTGTAGTAEVNDADEVAGLEDDIGGEAAGCSGPGAAAGGAAAGASVDELRGTVTVTSLVVKTVVAPPSWPSCPFPGAPAAGGALELHGCWPCPPFPPLLLALLELDTGTTTSGTGTGNWLVGAGGAASAGGAAGALLTGAFPAGGGVGACGAGIAGTGPWSSVATGFPFESSNVIGCAG